MKRIRLLMLALLAAFSLGAIAASSAMAEELPWILPTPSATEPLTFTSESDSEPILQTTKGREIKCVKAKNTGEFTSARLGKVEIDFEGCKEGTQPCQNEAKEVILVNGDIHLVDILPTAVLDLGLWIEPLEGSPGTNKVLFKCGVLTVEVLGSVIGEVDNEHGELLKTLEKGKHFIILWKNNGTVGEQQIKTCDLPEAFCKGKTFELKSTFGLGEELAAEIVDVLILFLKEIEIHF